MVNKTKILSDLSKIAVDAMSTFSGIKKEIETIILDFDINKFGKSKSKFDKNELSILNSKIYQLIDFEEINIDLNKMNISITKEFWNLIRGNIALLKNVKDWWDICFGTINSIIENQDFLDTALEVHPIDQFNEKTWSTWTKKLSQVTGKKGKELYMPLRLCLTGQNKGPEMADLILMMGRDKVIKRLSNQV